MIHSPIFWWKYGNLLHSESTNLNVNNVFKNTFTVKCKLVFNQKYGHCSLAKLRYNIKYYKMQVHFPGQEKILITNVAYCIIKLIYLVKKIVPHV